ncbi:MAG TPA: TetR/AcrR family transcriptional regulator [Arthrobacter sp.]|nr:TetR/AcrR family transcriptional regulator [Arthrobacter sp.]
MTEKQTAPRTAPPRRPARHALLEAAAKRFYAFGLTGTGIDSITAEAGVAKKSLYTNFASKTDLVTAYLYARHEEWLGLYRARLEKAAHPKDRVLAVFDAYADPWQSTWRSSLKAPWSAPASKATTTVSGKPAGSQRR